MRKPTSSRRDRAGERAILRLGSSGETFVSIVRVGLAETKHFAEGYEAIFGTKKKAAKKDKPAAKKASAGKKKNRKK
jgi:hypothetical protein